MNNLLSVKNNKNTLQPRLAALSFCVLLLAGCSGLSNSGSGLYQPTPWVLEQNRNRLATIESLIQTDQRDEAKNNADSINPAELSTEQKAQLNLLYGQILILSGDTQQALRRFAQIQPQELSLLDQIKYFQASAQAYASVGDFLSSAKARIELEPLITQPGEQKKNQTAIFESLSLIPDNVLKSNQSLANSPLAEWLELASLLKAKNQNPALLSAAIMNWRTMYPSHPANSSFLQSHQKALTDMGMRPRSIAFLLPESGVFADAAKAIRAGIMAAYNHESTDPGHPTLHFYDSEAQSATDLYHQALDQGANLIAGPLDKEKIQELANSVQFSVPVLALNHVQGLRKNNLYQFGLSPMDDAEQITNKAWLDGHRNAMILTQDNEQGNRIARYLADSWRSKGGKVIIKKTYSPKNTNFSFISKKLLNLDESNNRYRRLAHAVPNAHHRARARKDVDVILLNAYSDEAKLINAEIQSTPVKIYAMSSVYNGRPNPGADAALSKINFCDAPWLFNQAYTGDLSMQALPNWSQFNNQYYRLIAMGIDAYYLAAQLNNLQATPYYGATGKLSLTDDQRVKRELVCATFVAGQPELRGYINGGR